MIQLAFKAIADMLIRQGLTILDSDQLYCQCISTLVPFLS
jgi:hypothetical protein